ncbi:Uu.00g011730.m01.CDS01 [Anthostomella pinea]|uniref:Uu.00g011730.m01.CDS01 n=1 Tax=Anthostomella pinea TaxID=933095 RepID=A0AAI8YQ17_9PEZI|nr:Uu.00g011730.m01.CDS01 [Anthostomella pinea]
MKHLAGGIVLVAVSASFGLATSQPRGPPNQRRFKWEETKHIIAFGDYYTFVQGTAGYPGFSFIGDYRPGHLSFTPEELLTDKIVQGFGGTSADGPNCIEYLSGCAVEDGEWLPSECKMQLWNFAFAGADVSEQSTPLHAEYVVPLVNQTQQYLTWAEPVIGGHMKKERALVAIWIGINDISDTSKYNASLLHLYSDIMDSMFRNSIEPLYRSGYHNFLFLNLPPVDRTPANLLRSSPSPNKMMIEWWNEKLAGHVQDFSNSHNDATALLYDTNTFLNGVLDEPSMYGVHNITDFCPGYNNSTVLTDPGAFGCAPLDGYYWFNQGHITSHIHELIADDLRGFLESH